MKIALTQMDIAWEDPAANESTVRRLVAAAAAAGTDMVVFPEFTFVGFTKRPELFCDTPRRARQLEFLCELSREHAPAIVAGRIVASPTRPRNNLTLVRGGEVVLSYDKLHSYSHGGEDAVYSSGDRIATAALAGMELGAFICYDLRFPEIFQVAARKAEAIVVIGNWPQDRLENWLTLLRARALETQTYMVGVNRTGAGGGVVYGPSSVVFDPAGRRLTPATADELFCCEVESGVVAAVRESFPLRRDRREDLYSTLLFRDPAHGRIG
ncbi:MAG: nitrilase-related carbon-nitrogen hydrolase [Kiritimatiellia bacterium]